MKKTLLILSLLFAGQIFAGSVMMTSDWAEELCEEWNDNDTLTTELTSWMENDLDRGYKVMLMKRNDCENAPFVQITLQKEDDLTTCTYGGVVTKSPNDSADYTMTASTKNWVKMGSGDLGPVAAMLTGRLKFKGPKGEAMKNMTAFESFLLLVGAFESDTSSCE
jgi:putative sterol carrier protein